MKLSKYLIQTNVIIYHDLTRSDTMFSIVYLTQESIDPLLSIIIYLTSFSRTTDIYIGTILNTIINYLIYLSFF